MREQIKTYNPPETDSGFKLGDRVQWGSIEGVIRRFEHAGILLAGLELANSNKYKMVPVSQLKVLE
jgi:hypothetical protein